MPARGGILLERVSQGVIRQTRANRVWDGDPFTVWLDGLTVE